jgi:methylthioribose-1-phosphate isomerase
VTPTPETTPSSGPPTLRFDHDAGELVLLDQTWLPNEVRFIRLGDAAGVEEAIARLRVRGAPAIGVAAAYGAYLGALRSAGADGPGIEADLRAACERLNASRPTAVNLSWALRRMTAVFKASVRLPRAALLTALLREADAIRDEDVEVCRRIGENGLTLLKPGWGLLTHCNAGALATAGEGTATAPIYLGARRGYGFHVYSDETRPLLQGARLTAWELQQAGIEVTVICDSMAASVLAQGKVAAVLVGCDRVAANGDVANKIGTSGLAIVARHYGIPLYVHAPLSSVDRACASGRDIPIEERAPTEITEMWYSRRMAPNGVGAYNPAFDVTEASLVSAIVTERGVLRPPFASSIAAAF